MRRFSDLLKNQNLVLDKFIKSLFVHSQTWFWCNYLLTILAFTSDSSIYIRSISVNKTFSILKCNIEALVITLSWSNFTSKIYLFKLEGAISKMVYHHIYLIKLTISVETLNDERKIAVELYKDEFKL